MSKVFETPILRYNGRYNNYETTHGLLFACAEVVEELFDTPRDSEIKFVAYDKPGPRRHGMSVMKYFDIVETGRYWLEMDNWAIVAMHGELWRFLAEIYRKYDDKIFYVECKVL